MVAQSSAIRWVAYKDAERELHVFFRNGGHYAYFDVPREVYDGLMDSPSRGAYLNEHIKGAYTCERRDAPRRRIWLDEKRWPFGKKSA